MLAPSPKQKAVHDAFNNTKNHICVQATAGSGKTKGILIPLLTFVPKFKRAIFLSFSTGIVSELKELIPEGIEASTLHSLGCRAIFRSYRNIKVVEDKYFRKTLFVIYPDKESRDKNTFRDCYRIQDICGFIRMTMTERSVEEITKMCEYYGLDYTIPLIEAAILLLEPEKNFTTIDFADMIYLPVVDPNITINKYDYIFLDEAQDLNNCQRQLVEKSLRGTTGRLIAVGDSYQSIYSFAGAAIDSFEKLQKRENTTTLPLDVSYRCPKAVIRKAQTVCDSITFPDNAKEGIMRFGDVDEIEEGNLILCRNTRPLIALYFYLIENGIAAKVVGKDIEQGLVQLATRCNSAIYEIFHKNTQKELDTLHFELKELGVKIVTEHARYVALSEKIKVLLIIFKKLERGESIIDRLKEMFSENSKAAKLMTLHRAKGLEADRVFIIERFNNDRLLPSKYALQEHELIQERNLAFVGYTRAKEELVLVNYND